LITIVGWDVGGVNVKAAWLAFERGEAEAVRVASRPFEIWRDKDRLPQVLQAVLVLFVAAPGVIRTIYRIRVTRAGGRVFGGWAG
jgi:uncharacterized hydantoinase/oxoprolinase family protein